MGPHMIMITVFMNLIYQVFFVGSFYWLSLWSNDDMTERKNKDKTMEKEYLHIGVYAFFGIAQGWKQIY